MRHQTYIDVYSCGPSQRKKLPPNSRYRTPKINVSKKRAITFTVSGNYHITMAPTDVGEVEEGQPHAANAPEEEEEPNIEGDCSSDSGGTDADAKKQEIMKKLTHNTPPKQSDITNIPLKGKKINNNPKNLLILIHKILLKKIQVNTKI